MENYVTQTEFGDFRGEMSEFKTEMREFKNEMYDFKIEMREFKAEVNAKFTEILEVIGYYSNRTESRLDRIEATMVTKADLERTTYELKGEIHSAIRQHERVMHT